MDKLLLQIEKNIYTPNALLITNYELAQEGNPYAACEFNLNAKHVIYRNAKVTPTKTGQFVTFWKRNHLGVTVPYAEADKLDFLIITTKSKTNLGQFVFPKSVLINKGIISTDFKSGKRGFRLYPSWDTPTSKQALNTQQWQLKYFYTIEPSIDISFVKSLLNN